MRPITRFLSLAGLAAILFGVLLSGCSMQAPVVIIVTPTHAPGTPQPPVTPSAVPNQVAQASTPTTPPATPIPPTQVPSTIPPTQPLTVASDVTPMATFGPVLGPTYTPPTPITPSATPPGTVAGSPTVPSTGSPTLTGTPGPSPTPLPTLARNAMGIQIHGYLNDADWQTMLNHAKALGVGWIKVQIAWKELEPARGNYNTLYQSTILNIQRAHAQGFKTMISLDKAPDWARSPGQHSDDGPPLDPQDLANFATNLVFDIKPEFLDAIEVWNEPNLISEWNGVPFNGATYMKYFDATYHSIRNEEQLVTPTFNIQHHIVIIVAAPASGTPDGAGSVNDRNWINQLYAAGLTKYGGDIALGVHPYGWGNAPEADCCTPGPGVSGWYNNRGFFFKDTLDDYRKIMVSNHHDAAQLWVTEFGWATYDGLHRSDGSPASPPTDPSFGWLKILNAQQQADYVIRAFTMAQHPPYNSYLGPMMLWNLNFGAIPQMIDTGRQEAGFSLLDNNGSPRLVYQALAAAPKQ
ncbi:MAG: hypothetical protein ACYDBJ_08500 [Aggregatilineales bacterium]